MKKSEYKGMDLDDLDEDELEQLEEPPRKKKPIKKKPVEKKERYIGFQVPERKGIADGETGEIIVEGDMWLQQAIAKMMQVLERIEQKIGALVDE